MAGIPADVETDAQPPLRIPLRHFLVGLGFLLAGGVLGVARALGLDAGLATAAHVHLLLVGWVCLTIMGAMTQFVPVWSGVPLHSRRLAVAQLWLVAAGLAGFAAALLLGALALVPVFGGLMLAGVWTFAYNVGRTLAGAGRPDVTERHFASALGFFVLATALGLSLALDLAVSAFGGVPVTRAGVLGAHATLAVFGAVLTTVVGALYQLATMFTQTELHGVDHHLRRAEELAYPSGVLALAAGRLVGNGTVARVGGVLVAIGLLAVSVVLGRRLVETRVPWTPMLSRYAVVAPATAAGAVLAAAAWLDDPLARSALFGAPGTTHLLGLGVVAFVVAGTLYHVVPFIVWVHRYSDRLGFEDVPMIDDLYDDRLAQVDFGCLLVGSALVVGGDRLARPRVALVAGGLLVVVGSACFVANLALVVREHGPHSLRETVFGRGETGRDGHEGSDPAGRRGRPED